LAAWSRLPMAKAIGRSTLRSHIVFEFGEKEVILERRIDLQVASREPFPAEAASLEHAYGCPIRRHARCLDPVEADFVEGISECGRDRLAGISATHERQADPITD
jgi:hypothetical protein